MLIILIITLGLEIPKTHYKKLNKIKTLHILLTSSIFFNMDTKELYGNEEAKNLKAFVVLMRATQSISREHMCAIKESGLSVNQFGVLELLFHKGDLSISAITEKILSTAGNMTVVINNLIKGGYIARYQSPTDKRVSLVTLTSKGKETISLLFPTHSKNISTIFNRLSSEEKNVLTNLLKKLSGHSK